MKVKVQVLGSSSKGNATVLWNEKTAILVDCGMGRRYIERNLNRLDIKFSQIQGVFITHGHSDHVKKSSLRMMVQKNIKVFCHEDVAEVLKLKYEIARTAEKENILRTFRSGEIMEFNKFRVKGFEVVHDTHCYGFNIIAGSGENPKKITVATDLGCTDNGITDKFINSDVIIIESNYDRGKLENSPRPGWLKDRIADRSHLSNRECANFVKKVLEKSIVKPQAVILTHISQECNTGLLAQNTVRENIPLENGNVTKVLLSYEKRPTEVVSLF
ncbi:MAG: MBL fold metallo-hydrolase [Elusimicrobiota bacterium]